VSPRISSSPRKARQPPWLSRLAVLLSHWMLTSAFVGTWSVTVHGQPARADEKVIPPHLNEPPEVAYPEGGTGDVTVVLVLVIEQDGTVRSANVEAGDEPFASAARLAAAAWVFEPALRAGVAVADRIRFQVKFVQQFVEEAPEPGVEPAEASSDATPTRAKPDPEPEPPPPKALDVFVEGERLPPSVTSLRRAEVRQLPGAFGDPFRAIEIMPGVTSIVSGLPFFYVRGAPPGNVGYFLDGVRVPYLFHVAAGPSVVHPGIVDRVDLYSGGYPARFGRFAGAVVSAETTPPRPDWHGEGVVRLVDAGALVEGGFADGKGTAR